MSFLLWHDNTAKRNKTQMASLQCMTLLALIEIHTPCDINSDHVRTSLVHTGVQ